MPPRRRLIVAHAPDQRPAAEHVTGVAVASKPTSAASMSTSPRGSRVWASLPVA